MRLNHTSSTTILTLAFATLVWSGTAWGAVGDCGQPVTEGTMPAATDARFVLLAAIGARVCDRCVCDVDGSGATVATDALTVLAVAAGLPLPLACPPCGVDAECPGIAQFALFSKIRNACATNADCGGLGSCDPTVSHCRTASDLDIGWTGLAHRMDLDDIVPARLVVDCTGPAPCGQCTIEGLDPQLGNCRCADDNRKVCFTPHVADQTTCGGATCECYFGPPLPLTAGNAPTCLVNAIDGQIGGTVDVDQGSGTIDVHLEERVHLGMSTLAPCPYCMNDTVPADGVRSGTCVGGLDDGQSCDAQSANATFPAPAGGRMSLDCFPSPGLNISGSGLRVALPLSTGVSTLPSTLACGPLGTELCPCLVCSGDVTLPCNADADCAMAGAGTCSTIGGGVTAEPNQCTDGVCEVTGGGLGQCATGPDDRFCDGIVRADGRGFLTCLSDGDCSIASLGVDAGACTLVEQRSCLPDTVVATGNPHPVLPVAAAAFCTPPTSNAGINNVTGLPGPTRWIQQAQVSLFCAGSPLDLYLPGVGGCP